MEVNVRPFVVLVVGVVVGSAVSTVAEVTFSKNIDQEQETKIDHIIRKGVTITAGIVAADVAIGIVDWIVFNTQR